DRYTFVKGDICDPKMVGSIFQEHSPDALVNFAAETHVDRSLLEAGSFVTTDVYGTYVLLEAARIHGIGRFLHVSTDEVYGDVAAGSSKETDHLSPRSPYSASKASADLMALAYHVSHNVPVIITRGSNNFGPHQYPEKFVPLFITNAIDDMPLPLYGDGRQVRDWIFVLDHCIGIDTALRAGAPGEIYNVGGGNERENIDIALRIVSALGKPTSLIKYVADRTAHDRRYSLDCGTLAALGWKPEHAFDDALETTVRWYQQNEGWWRRIKSGEYLDYYHAQYGQRLKTT
ncbi:MAG: dTDP-glucose 4,6-dehydratase, partial [Dehalococcoidia bacterium]|nr:dTDP-glucose 4,6-dehydratase [Dehalococcoidia bacterium]